MMNSWGPKQLDIRQIYARYCDIVSGNDHAASRELLSMLSHSIESQGLARIGILTDLSKLMSCLNLSVDSRRFSCFYDFVFFICCENGQKNITVSRAITAWRLVLAGRFRLLDQWCCFVEEHQRHNISVDTWQQVLAFSRCVNEDLDGYDPKGAWPVLIDDFVEHMYSINQSNSSSREFYRSCSDMQAEPGIPSTFRGLALLPGSKRKLFSDSDRVHKEAEESLIDKSHLACLRFKRLKQSFGLRRRGRRDSNMATALADTTEDMAKHGSLACLKTSACAVEDGLAKVFEGQLLIGCCFQFEHKGSYT
ncbi:uncharacterized protein LOC110097570 isoform X1 [Dendrobium catenatum]|uniref:Defective in cullin neddylation protein n=2 Tax=Dendrobium catenatum TaxID=906689 RepID=A0A2I0XCL2_9ASPA|nr:uncharacterized protein LOC110097570 isoform X1 [Dendrobium catenatum]XP_020679801.1 uncharacterized protein LOC110097570 isoform X1 [Dendrobium catenatum]PKU85636.1 hypothetical protein MA16_Dca003377 [Dendrobium catenatum]